VPFTAFAIAMIVGRFSAGWIADRININRAAMFGGYFGGTAMTLGLISGLLLLPVNMLLAVAVQATFFFIAGLGESIMVPAFYSAAAHVRAIPTTQVLARMSLANSLIFIVAKGVMGSLADTVGLALAMIFPILAFFASGFMQGLIGKKVGVLKAKNLEDYPPTGSTPVVKV
jgi:hypothetical protein